MVGLGSWLQRLIFFLTDPLSQHPPPKWLPISCCHGCYLPSGRRLLSTQRCSGIFLPRLEPHTSISKLVCRLPEYQSHTWKICSKSSPVSRWSSANTSGTQRVQAGTSVGKRAQCVLLYVREAASSCWLLALWERRGRQWAARLSIFK